ncbi:MAG TPA: PEP/pyruvate-binding domain-containing protein [Gemmatimonadales bacterium]|nr:PEP/pyruvate-binding domain-containing protein [Gemmatimonadales bacterium]
MSPRRIALAVVFGVAACAPPVARVVSEVRRSAGEIGDYAPAIRSEAMWQLLAARPGTEHLARSEVVKVIIDRSDGEVYFMESKRWPVHFFFAQTFLNKPGRPVEDQVVFNMREYKADDRRFVLATVTHVIYADRWVFDLFPGDTLSLQATADAFRATRGRVFFGGALAYRPVPPQHERDIDQARALMPVVTTDEIYGKIRYQPNELGEAYGYLRVFPRGARFEPTAVRPYDVLVLGEQPPDIPVVAGVITDALQAPLAHISLLCHNRKTPNMALRDASNSAEVKALAGKLVHLTVGAQGYRLEPATQADAEASWAKKRPAKGYRPRRDDRPAGMPLLADLGRRDIALVGAKTAQLAFAASRLPAGVTPRGFALPFWAYARFLRDNGLQTKLTAMLGDPAFLQDPEVRRTRLDAFRAEMAAAPVPADIVADLLRRIHECLPPGQVRLRSSTNAEDLPGFNGAGLYRSTRVDPGDPAAVARGLRDVWASTWLWAAFEEREYYRIDQHTVGMAILVQQSIDDDVANGVAITANPFNQGDPGFFINAQLSSGSVTSAKGDEIPEQILFYTFDGGRGFERLSRSSRAGGRIILEDSVVEELERDLDVVHRAFTGDDPDAISGHAVDVEFLVRATAPRVVIVQARPFEVTWSADRLWLDRGGDPVSR